MAVLEIESGVNKGKRLKVPDREIVVGRGESADLRINSVEMSREHCRLTPEGTTVVVVDLGSSNGTFVNGRPITEPTTLNAGDRVSFGPITLRLLGVRKPAPKQAKPPANDSKMVDPDVVAKARKVSDDDVSSWLNDNVGEEAEDHEDTKILSSTAAAAIQQSVSAKVAETKPTFASVAEEAADIIRRHNESIAQA